MPLAGRGGLSKIETAYLDGTMADLLARFGTARARGAYSAAARAGMVFPPTGNFSPDGSKFLTYRLDETRSPELSLIQYLPDDGSVRPKVWSYRIPLSGDPPSAARLVLSDLATGARVDVDHPPSMIEFRTPLPFRQIEWSADGRSCYFVDFTEDLRDGWYDPWYGYWGPGWYGPRGRIGVVVSRGRGGRGRGH